MNGQGRAFSVAIEGVVGRMVEVEADIGASLPGFVLLGLPDASLLEAKERIRAAVRHAGHPLPARKITVNLLPAGMPKRGPGFDLAIVAATLQAQGEIRPSGKTVFLGELTLDGRLRPIGGVLPAVLAAVKAGHRAIICPRANHAEAALVPGAEVASFDSLDQVLAVFGSDRVRPEPVSPRPAPAAVSSAADAPDFAEVLGQPEACRAALVAAAGGHHLLLAGPPGVGKTMIAERLPGILPELSPQEALEVSAVHSASGLGFREGLLRTPPFERPHHTATAAALLGGGAGWVRPGAASRAHRGVLFLDEACEFQRNVIDALRQPLESGVIRVDRARFSVELPAAFQLVLATNPCPCGMKGAEGRTCTCTSLMRRRYLGRLSGPVLDRIDVRVALRPPESLLDGPGAAMTSAEARAQVAVARERAQARLRELGHGANALVSGRDLRGPLRLPSEATEVLDRALASGLVSPRGYDRILRVAWTIADLDGTGQPGAEQVAEAGLLREAEGVSLG